MSYTSHVFQTGDLLDAPEMNNIIAGIDELNDRVAVLEGNQDNIDTELEIIDAIGTRADKTQNGITYTWTDNVCTVSGTATAMSFNNLFVLEPLMDPVLPGYIYSIKLNNTDANIIMRVFYTVDGVSQNTYLTNDCQFIIPAEATRTVLRIEVSSGNTVDGTIAPELYIVEKAPTTEDNDSTGSKHSLKILCIGNSYTLNSIPYVPYILKNLANDEIDLTIGSSYYSGCKIDQYVDFFNNSSAVLRYDKNKNFNDNWSRTTELTLQDILADEDWDIITFQQASSYQEDYSTYSNLNTLINSILNYKLTIHPKAIKFGWLMPQIRLSKKTDVSFDNIVSCVELVLMDTPIDFVIPCCTAIENARGTSLNAIGTYEGLVADTNGHLQTGLPVLISSYVTSLSILSLLGITYHGILGEQTRPTADWCSGRILPSNNGTSIGVTEENCILAQKCAIAAMKKPFEISSIIE